MVSLWTGYWHSFQRKDKLPRQLSVNVAYGFCGRASGVYNRPCQVCFNHPFPEHHSLVEPDDTGKNIWAEFFSPRSWPRTAESSPKVLDDAERFVIATGCEVNDGAVLVEVKSIMFPCRFYLQDHTVPNYQKNHMM